MLFHEGLLSFNIIFCVLLTPGGSGNKAFQDIIPESTICLSAVFVSFSRFSSVSLLCFLGVGLQNML